MIRLLARVACAALLALSCCAPDKKAAAPAPSLKEPVISILALNDLHGRIEALPVFAGYANNVRAARRTDGGGLLLLDAGDMLQGTLACNIDEGASLFDTYHAVGFTATTLGNHEFDFGPIGTAVTNGEHDSCGAIKQRVAHAAFPVLSANLVDRTTRAPVSWPNLRRSILIHVSGVPIGIIGGMTEEAPRIIRRDFFAGLDVAPLAAALRGEAARLRSAGAELVIGLVHAGGECRKFDDPRDLSSCDDSEVFQLARALPRGLVDVIVGGHTHAGIAHFVNGIAVVEAYVSGRAFSRVDVKLDPRRRHVAGIRVYAPHPLCPDEQPCVTGVYEGRPVQPSAEIERIIAPQLAATDAIAAQSLGVVVERALPQEHKRESALGNLLVDLMLEAVPGADLAVANGGSLRADLRAGPLTYGELYKIMPFDNRLAVVTLRADSFERVLARHLQSAQHGIVSISGVRVVARCEGGALGVSLVRSNGKFVRPDETLTIVTSDYLATGGDALFNPATLGIPQPEADQPLLRDVLARRLEARGPRLEVNEPDAAHRRLDLPSPRPITCAAPR